MKRWFWIAGVLMVIGVALLVAGVGPAAVSAAVITVGMVLVVIAEEAGTRSS